MTEMKFNAAIDLDLLNRPSSLMVEFDGLTEPIEIGLDYFGEERPRFQTIHYNADGDGEAKVKVRYDKTGKIVEVCVEDREIRITSFDRGTPLFTHMQRGLRVCQDGDRTPWELERDGEV